jgi:hypothetical protein
MIRILKPQRDSKTKAVRMYTSLADLVLYDHQPDDAKLKPIVHSIRMSPDEQSVLILMGTYDTIDSSYVRLLKLDLSMADKLNAQGVVSDWKRLDSGSDHSSCFEVIANGDTELFGESHKTNPATTMAVLENSRAATATMLVYTNTFKYFNAVYDVCFDRGEPGYAFVSNPSRQLIARVNLATRASTIVGDARNPPVIVSCHSKDCSRCAIEGQSDSKSQHQSTLPFAVNGMVSLGLHVLALTFMDNTCGTIWRFHTQKNELSHLCSVSTTPHYPAPGKRMCRLVGQHASDHIFAVADESVFTIPVNPSKDPVELRTVLYHSSDDSGDSDDDTTEQDNNTSARLRLHVESVSMIDDKTILFGCGIFSTAVFHGELSRSLRSTLPILFVMELWAGYNVPTYTLARRKELQEQGLTDEQIAMDETFKHTSSVYRFGREKLFDRNVLRIVTLYM